ncbi:F-box only protein 16-like isoform X2 [Mytilus californianus]|uniref:F-box only protein 16-like isoform X2 n=1 Tax=Mytilus californianus TaxID=6549 RepID=UPI0022467C95|nr:F-box only protein 16-like isoform X2 [Mytilus californianus]
MSKIAKNRIKSAWTPLSNGETNNKIFEERRGLLKKWYEKWTDEQRKRIIEDLVHVSKIKQLQHAQTLVNDKVPMKQEDFTRVLPKVLSVYLFSFLDPRSLCRASRVCWHWKFLTESDQLWMPKCLRLGWYLPFTPSPYETGVWKRNYIENIKSLQVLRPKLEYKKHDALLELERLKISQERALRSQKDKKKNPQPWRGSDPVPKDTWRYNVLENNDIVGDVNKMRKKKSYGPHSDYININARSKVKTGQNILNQARKSQSMSRLSYSMDAMNADRPQWARDDTSQNINVSFDKNVSKPRVKPGHLSPEQKMPKQPPSARSERDPPTARLFPETPWKVPDSTDSD